MCDSVVAAESDDATQCYALGDCSGLSCTLTPDFGSGAVVSRDVVVGLDKCKDPLISMVTVYGNNSSFQRNVSGSGAVFFGGGESLAVGVTRNATFANLTVSKVWFMAGCMYVYASKHFIFFLIICVCVCIKCVQCVCVCVCVCMCVCVCQRDLLFVIAI